MKRPKKGDWVHVVRAELGALGAKGMVGQVITTKADHGLETTHGAKGLRLQIGTEKWNIGVFSVVEPATERQINKAIKALNTPPNPQTR